MNKKFNYRINKISEKLFKKFKKELIDEFKIDISKLENSSFAEIKGKKVSFRYKRSELVNESMDIELILNIPIVAIPFFNNSLVKNEFKKKLSKYNWNGELLEI